MEKWGKEIENSLKLYCFRHFSPDTVRRLLYEPGRELELTFDLTGASHISTGMLENLERFLKFDEILQLVALPAFPDKDNREGKRGVKRILHLVVNDMVDSPQSDSAIENALRGLDIEELDWKREDICSESIRRAAPGVLILHLYCSGRNPVLRAWSGSDGLVTLQKLREATLTCRTGLESKDRTHKNIFEFTDRLEQSFRRVERHIKISTALRDHESEAIQDPMDSVQMKHTPRSLMSAMLEISDALRMFEKVKSSHPVKVALVCDGVDLARCRLVDCITSGTSLDSFASSGANVAGLYKPWYLSSRNYGSQMATLIADVCPSAKIHILRIETAAEDPKLLQRAIWSALENKVDIICLALDSPWDWTLTTKDENREESARLQKALRQARNKDVPIFCPQDCMMSSTYREEVTGIRAPEITKDGSQWAWSSETAMFLFPGALEGKPSESPEDQSLPETSFATGLATGVAAALLQLQNICGRRMGMPSERILIENGFKYLASGGRVVQTWQLSEILRRIMPNVQNGNGDVVENMRREIGEILLKMVENKER
ncbi:hypothetical protein F5Y08DRAFT_349465 [Xylaria arbuscula]|nr:hypothetical protein F5Y08DRAFT_349465 [Xylaria arbuscula]